MNNDYYFPDKWVVLKMKEGFYKVFATWAGNYIHGDNWRLNSGIKNVTLDEDGNYLFHGYSGSIYVGKKNCYGIRPYSVGVVDRLEERIPDLEVLPEDTDFLNLPIKDDSDV